MKNIGKSKKIKIEKFKKEIAMESYVPEEKEKVDIHQYAYNRMVEEDVPPEDMEKELVDKGYSGNEAKTIVDEASEKIKKNSGGGYVRRMWRF